MLLEPASARQAEAASATSSTVDHCRRGSHWASGSSAQARCCSALSRLLSCTAVCSCQFSCSSSSISASCWCSPETVGQAQVQGVAGVDRRAGQAEEQAELARQAGQEPAGADVRVQADADFRHGQAAAGCDDAHIGALQQPMPPPSTCPWPQHSNGLG
jgi:hypothetical protein